MDMCNRASPSDLSGPIAASLASAVMSDPEKPVDELVAVNICYEILYIPSVNVTKR